MTPLDSIFLIYDNIFVIIGCIYCWYFVNNMALIFNVFLLAFIERRTFDIAPIDFIFNTKTDFAYSFFGVGVLIISGFRGILFLLKKSWLFKSKRVKFK